MEIAGAQLAVGVVAPGKDLAEFAENEIVIPATRHFQNALFLGELQSNESRFPDDLKDYANLFRNAHLAPSVVSRREDFAVDGQEHRVLHSAGKLLDRDF